MSVLWLLLSLLLLLGVGVVDVEGVLDLGIAGEMKFYTNETVMYLDSSNSRLVFKSSLAAPELTCSSAGVKVRSIVNQTDSAMIDSKTGLNDVIQKNSELFGAFGPLKVRVENAIAKYGLFPVIFDGLFSRSNAIQAFIDQGLFSLTGGSTSQSRQCWGSIFSCSLAAANDTQCNNDSPAGRRLAIWSSVSLLQYQTDTQSCTFTGVSGGNRQSKTLIDNELYLVKISCFARITLAT